MIHCLLIQGLLICPAAVLLQDPCQWVKSQCHNFQNTLPHPTGVTCILHFQRCLCDLHFGILKFMLLRLIQFAKWSRYLCVVGLSLFSVSLFVPPVNVTGHGFRFSSRLKYQLLFYPIKRCYNDAITLFCVPIDDLDNGLEYVCLCSWYEPVRDC